MIFKTVTHIQKSEEMLRLRSAEQSRRDVTLLTVEFILRTICAAHSLQVPKGRYFERMIVSSLRDFGAMLFLRLRRLKPTVNQVLSLRDISPLTQHDYKLFIFHPLIKN